MQDGCGEVGGRSGPVLMQGALWGNITHRPKNTGVNAQQISRKRRVQKRNKERVRVCEREREGGKEREGEGRGRAGEGEKQEGSV